MQIPSSSEPDVMIGSEITLSSSQGNSMVHTLLFVFAVIGFQKDRSNNAMQYPKKKLFVFINIT